jgi:beta-galactosidase/beta-glucuronidase
MFAAAPPVPFEAAQSAATTPSYHRLMDTLDAPVYPRPQLVRERWSCLDGWWEFAFDDDERGLVERWTDGRRLPLSILVPFPYQGPKSGFGTKDIHEVVWYARSFEVPADWAAGELLLHFCAVDYRTEVWVNGRNAGRNHGGHVPFYVNIAPYLVAGQNRLTLRVEDRQDPYQPRGKQSVSGRPVRIYYHCTTGIWQTVWLEPVPPVRIDHLRITEAMPDGTIALQVNLHAPFGDWEAELDVLPELDSEQVIARTRASTRNASIALRTRVEQPQAWSPSTPHLYKLRVRLLQHGRLLDSVESYTGLRTVEVRDRAFCLNGEPAFLLMVLDQGYWPESILAPPSDQALHDDVAWIKRFGFNGVRKHQKIESERWLYWCDRLGLMVWEEMPNTRFWSDEAQERLQVEWLRAVMRDIDHPSIVAWVPVVESLGFPELQKHPEQHAFLERMVARTRLLDPTRPVIDNDGWQHTDVTDICTIHDYSHPAEKLLARYADTVRTGLPPAKGWFKEKPLFLQRARYRGQPIVLSEVGGFLTAPPAGQRRDRLFDHYCVAEAREDLVERYRDLMEGLATLRFLAGVCYTQLTDVEHEQNGLLTADRQPKLPPGETRRLHRRLWPPA